MCVREKYWIRTYLYSVCVYVCYMYVIKGRCFYHIWTRAAQSNTNKMPYTHARKNLFKKNGAQNHSTGLFVIKFYGNGPHTHKKKCRTCARGQRNKRHQLVVFMSFWTARVVLKHTHIPQWWSNLLYAVHTTSYAMLRN